MISDSKRPVKCQKKGSGHRLEGPRIPTGVSRAFRVEREALTAGDLKAYEGTYYCEELDARYEITPGEGRLVLGSPRAGDISLTPENRKTFVSGAGFPLVLFLIGEKGEVTGFRLESDSLSQLIFRKE